MRINGAQLRRSTGTGPRSIEEKSTEVKRSGAQSWILLGRGVGDDEVVVGDVDGSTEAPSRFPQKGWRASHIAG